MVVVGPEEPLVKGIADFLKADERLRHLHIIGPGSSGARLEGSKAFAKTFMQKHGIATAAYRKFNAENYHEGVAYLNEHPVPIVIKADGLASGKGVVICGSRIEALAEYEHMLKHSKFGKAGSTVVVEEFLQGTEISVFVLTDGEHYLMLPEAKDYKRIGEGDKGLNTGGMGAVSPVPLMDATLQGKIIHRIIEPTIRGLKEDGIDYKGFIFFGLIKVNGEPYVIEYNCRMGDPETQVVIPRLKNDLAQLLVALGEGRLREMVIETEDKCAAAVVAVSGGYPGDHETGKIILGLGDPLPADSILFLAGAKPDEGDVLTAGGRVLAVTSLADDIHAAVRQSLSVLEHIYFDGINYRTDIGYEFVAANPGNTNINI
jgi:phosphoribosylamine--glycine ligase